MPYIYQVVHTTQSKQLISSLFKISLVHYDIADVNHLRVAYSHSASPI